MREININNVPMIPTQGHTSKGDQPKWLIDNTWYKADHMGYESLAEIIVSELLKKSNITDFVKYEPVLIHYNDKTKAGCLSENFLETGESLIPLEKLHRAYEGQGLAAALASFDSAKERILYTVNFVDKITGLSDFGAQLCLMLEIDALFLNEDRHTNNIAVIRNDQSGEYRLCPIFDNGLSLLSDLNDYPAEGDVYALISKVKAKPFSMDFDEQLEAVEESFSLLYKPGFSRTDIEAVFASVAELYPAEITLRVKTVLLGQMRKYSYLFQR